MAKKYSSEKYFAMKGVFETILERIAPALDASDEENDAFCNAMQDMLDAMN